MSPQHDSKPSQLPTLNSVSASLVTLISSKIEGLFTQESRPGRSAGYLVGGMFALDGFDWSNGIRYHIFDTKPDTELKPPRANE